MKCPSLTKTNKVKLFSEFVLRNLCNLFNWQGPNAWVADGKRKKPDEDDQHMEVEYYSENLFV